MPDLSAADVQAYTAGRLGVDARTDALLDTALKAVRLYCGWHVTPVITDDVVLDGPGGPTLILPTLRLCELLGVREDGVDLDVDVLRWSRRGMVQKPCLQPWSREFSALKVSMRHGFDDVPDWQAVVLSSLDRAAQAQTGGRRRAVGPFVYELSTMADGSMFTTEERAVLDEYRLEWRP